jgi:hypothetical protein
MVRLCTHTLLVIILLGGIFASSPATLAAPNPQPSAPTPPSIEFDSDGLAIAWQNRSAPIEPTPSLAALAPEWPLTEIGDAKVPAQLIALQVPHDVIIEPQISHLETIPWQGTILSREAIVPQTIDGELRPDLAVVPDVSLPDAPLVVLRDATIRDTRIVVLALSAVFSANGQPQALTAIKASVPGAQPLSTSIDELLASGEPFLASASGPSNPLAAQNGVVTVRVSQPGIQRITGSALTAAGINLATLNPSQVRLRHKGVEVALEMRLGGDSKLDAADEIRFYAEQPGDRWNATTTYWLSVESGSGLRMSTRNTAPASATVRTIARERGVWYQPTFYDSLQPGLDGDHWFAADLKSGPGLPAMSVSFTLTPTLPLASGTSILTATGAAYMSGPHNLQLRLGSTNQQATWNGTGNWTQARSFGTSNANVTVSLLPGSVPDGLTLDQVAWERPVTLNFANRGAFFDGVSGTWRYQLSNVASGSTLYDITNPTAPSILTLSSGTSPLFQDGPTPRKYVLAGTGTLHTPEVRAHTPTNLATPRNANVVYIAPAAFHSALTPLVQRRQSQGHAVAVIDVQAIYNAWSFGNIDPAAIRAFLRYAAATWSRVPSYVILVGDGTSDPRNYTDRNNATFIPPYLAMVDPWIGETACDACYAQLTGNDPLDDMLPDLALGRFPVKSVAELQALVSKVISYETATGGLDWRSRAVYLADNYREANGTVDPAGDFALTADQSITELPQGMQALRLYYDPWISHQGVPWREPNAAKARERTLELFNNGAGLVTFMGHSHQWQWAVTDTTKEPSSLLSLYDPDGLTNADKLPIVLAMTCLSSAFQTPAFSGTTVDERLLLAKGGAAAVWGSTGLGVAYGHDALMRGFMGALRAAPAQRGQLGSLTMAGYWELFMHNTCCKEALRTFVLLGDPLMPARVEPAQRLYAPWVRK